MISWIDYNSLLTQLPECKFHFSVFLIKGDNSLKYILILYQKLIYIWSEKISEEL